MFYSPLRYPGGKNKLAGFIAKICVDNDIRGHYIEPYAGGAGVAIFLLLEGFVERITINDKDRSIYAFWHSVVFESEALCNLIESTPITVENWQIQKNLQEQKERISLLELGFSTLFLNRTNRSGIIKGGMIGGRQQLGDYKLDCRFTKDEIIRRIKDISLMKDRIRLLSMDALDLVDLVPRQELKSTIIYFDPPYYLKAEQLYMNYYQHDDHADVAKKIANIEGLNWIVSYDNQVAIKNLYSEYNSKEYTFNHSAHTSKEGKEILFFSPGLNYPKLQYWNPTEFKLENKASGKVIVFRPKKPKAVDMTKPIFF
ncbi:MULTISPECIES: DNA adenine methylase [unclassified Flavobacterium]|uniref:DNA adenine methylase n=1 Tax=unclassified Flavobacterium TaxID=196869 RepID=UPI001F13143F|nr:MULTISPECIES: DNA adenine methylase [unclassified Flavobacterium]UMY64853.1 DNA adenine methylase [Flavobacterium sp. HJ-32-4]